MEFCILGHLEVTQGGEPIQLGGSRERTVLAMLLLEANHVIPVDRLIDAVWGEDPPATSRGQIQICISNLRRRILTAGGKDLIETRSPGYLLRVEAGTLDLHLFEAGVTAGRLAVTAGDPLLAARTLRDSLALWRGPALADVDSTVVQLGVARLNERRLSALGESYECGLLAGEHRELVGELAGLVEAHPLQEHFRALLMTALYCAGRQAEALDAYRRARDVLMGELGIEPGEELRRLHREMLAGTFAPAVLVPPPTATGAEAGAEGGPAAGTEGTQPPARPQDTGSEPAVVPEDRTRPRTPGLLPADIPDFTGRKETVEFILNQVGVRNPDGPDPRDEAREREQAVCVCVIVGQGGAGKTTLAVHVAHQLAADFPDGQLFAHLRAGDRPMNPTDILERFLRVLGVSGPALPKTLEERAELFRDLLSGRRMLIVLDDAMTERQVASLLPGTSGSSVIVTSRRRLTGLPSAGRVEIGALSESSAAELLARIVGADRVAAEPKSISELSQLCGHLPLALRICAARLAARPHWSVADLVDRLVDESRRLDELNHGEMEVRASISLTYDSLSEDARTLFRRLALLEAPSFAAWVGSPLLQVDVLRAQEALEVLAEAYLIDAKPGPGGQVRYRFHDIMRPFARERLVEESAEERRAALERWLGALLVLTGQAHRREYAGGFLERRSPASRWPLPERLVDRLLDNPLGWYEQERATIVAAVRQAAAGGMVEHCWDLALSSVTLFEAYSYFDDWRETHEVALKAACRAGDRHGEAAMRYSLGSLYMFEQMAGPALRQFEQAHALYTRLDDAHGAALVLRNMAYLDRLNGDIASALTRWEETLGVFQVAGDRIAEAHVLHNLAQVRLDCDEPEAAHQLLQRAAEICREVGNRRVGAQVHNRLGELHLRGGDLAAAAETYLAVLDMVRTLGDRVGECYALLGLATVDLRNGELDSATATLTNALELAVAAGAKMAEGRISLALAEVALAGIEGSAAVVGTAVDPGSAHTHAERALRGFEAIGAALFRARALVLRGRIHAVTGADQAAKASWQAAGGVLSGMRLEGAAVALSAELRGYLRALAERESADPAESAG